MGWPSRIPLPALSRRRRPRRVWQVPIWVDPSWLAIATFMTWMLATRFFPAQQPGLPTLVYWTMGAIAALSLFTCVLLHELAHCLVAIRHGMPVLGITLFIFGGVAQIGDEPQRPSVEFKMALAGPALSALLAAGCVVLAAAIPAREPAQLVAVTVVLYLAMVNTAIILFNLLPGFPLDGGRVLRAVLWAWTGSLRKATRIASAVGSAFGLGLLLLGLWTVVQKQWVDGLWLMLLGFFLRDAALASYRAARW